MPNRKVSHLRARLEGQIAGETFDICDESSVHFNDVYNELDKADAGYVLDARQGKALKEYIDNALSWKHLATTTGIETAHVSFPSDFRELRMVSNVSNVWIGNIITNYDIASSVKTFGNGYYRNENSYSAVQWSVSTTSVALAIAYKDGTNFGTTTTTYWFYR